MAMISIICYWLIPSMKSMEWNWPDYIAFIVISHMFTSISISNNRYLIIHFTVIGYFFWTCNGIEPSVLIGNVRIYWFKNGCRKHVHLTTEIQSNNDHDWMKVFAFQKDAPTKHDCLKFSAVCGPIRNPFAELFPTLSGPCSRAASLTSSGPSIYSAFPRLTLAR
jgi:hypothetical protein